MNERELEPTIRRILVALDASPHSQAALEAASELADVLKAELVGIFVEDVNLLHLAGLPFAREVGYPSGTDRPLDSPSMERELRIQAEQVRQTLAGVAVRRQIRWSFRVVRGQVATELLIAAQEADLLALGRASWLRPGGCDSVPRPAWLWLSRRAQCCCCNMATPSVSRCNSSMMSPRRQDGRWRRRPSWRRSPVAI